MIPSQDERYDVGSMTVALVLGCSRRHARNLMAEGRLKAIDIGRNPERTVYRTSKGLLRDFMEKALVEPGRE